ncbi:MAG: hypothetical protein K2W95_06555 [Candidatus Obscuribacterales bacterium]|nr:hypothetical protein [Candidatus Obscuribacterales bacterium]
MNKVDQPKYFPPLSPSAEQGAPGRPETPQNCPLPQQYSSPSDSCGGRGIYTPSAYNYQAPPPGPILPAFRSLSSAPVSFQSRGPVNYDSPLNALSHSVLWRNLANSGYGGAGPGLPGGNPFNLSPFGMLHYMLDDTTYVSDANPVTLYEVQNDLATARQQSALAQAAAQRARYASTPEEREQAAQQARYYAGVARVAAQRAKSQSQMGSLNPADVAAAAAEQAEDAANFANQASSYTRR